MEVPTIHRRKVLIEVQCDPIPLVADRHESSNIVNKLNARELYGGVGFPHCGADKYLTRSMHQNMTPNFSVTNILQPEAYLRTFTPDGKSFIGFVYHSPVTTVRIYKFLGPGGASHLFQSEINPKWRADNGIGSDECSESANQIRDNIFQSFFQKITDVVVAPPGFEANREFSLITSDSRYLIVGSARYEPYSNIPEDSMELDDNSSDDETDYYEDPLSDFCISVVDLNCGEVVSTSINYTAK